jgi:hypothetical protein
VSEDEARRDAYKELQTKNSRGVPNLQTAHRPLLLSCEALQGKQVPCAFLSKYQAEIASTELSSTVKPQSNCYKSSRTKYVFSFPGYKNNSSTVVVLLL